MAHSTSSPASIFSSELSPSMSSPRGPDAGGESVPEKRGPGHSKGSGKKAAMPATMPPESRKRGRPKGSCTKKILAALAAAAAPLPQLLSGLLRLLVARALQGNGGPVTRRGAGRGQCRRRPPLLRRLAAADGHRAARIRKLLLHSGPLSLAPRGPARRPLLRLVHLGFNQCCRRSSRRPTPRPKDGPPS
jgi:hypothetical protein